MSRRKTAELPGGEPRGLHRGGLGLLLRLLLPVVVVVVLFGVLTAVLFVYPSSPTVRHADAVVVPSGDHGERLAEAMKLIESGVTRTLVFAGLPDSGRQLCAGASHFEVLCLSPHPDNTRQEARAVGQLAKDRGWETIAVVTSTQHATRAGMLFRRCFSGTVKTIPARPGFDRKTTISAIRHEWLAVLHAVTVGRGC